VIKKKKRQKVLIKAMEKGEVEKATPFASCVAWKGGVEPRIPLIQQTNLWVTSDPKIDKNSLGKKSVAAGRRRGSVGGGKGASGAPVGCKTPG